MSNNPLNYKSKGTDLSDLFPIATPCRFIPTSNVALSRPAIGLSGPSTPVVNNALSINDFCYVPVTGKWAGVSRSYKKVYISNTPAFDSIVASYDISIIGNDVGSGLYIGANSTRLVIFEPAMFTDVTPQVVHTDAFVALHTDYTAWTRYEKVCTTPPTDFGWMNSHVRTIGEIFVFVSPYYLMAGDMATPDASGKYLSGSTYSGALYSKSITFADIIEFNGAIYVTDMNGKVYSTSKVNFLAKKGIPYVPICNLGLIPPSTSPVYARFLKSNGELLLLPSATSSGAFQGYNITKGTYIDLSSMKSRVGTSLLSDVYDYNGCIIMVWSINSPSAPFGIYSADGGVTWASFQIPSSLWHPKFMSTNTKITLGNVGDNGSNLTIAAITVTPGIISGIQLADGDRLLLLKQTNPIENGVYRFDIVSGTLIPTLDLESGKMVSVSSGSANTIYTGKVESLGGITGNITSKMLTVRDVKGKKVPDSFISVGDKRANGTTAPVPSIAGTVSLLTDTGNLAEYNIRKESPGLFGITAYLSPFCPFTTTFLFSNIVNPTGMNIFARLYKGDASYYSASCFIYNYTTALWELVKSIGSPTIYGASVASSFTHAEGDAFASALSNYVSTDGLGQMQVKFIGNEWQGTDFDMGFPVTSDIWDFLSIEELTVTCDKVVDFNNVVSVDPVSNYLLPLADRTPNFQIDPATGLHSNITVSSAIKNVPLGAPRVFTPLFRDNSTAIANTAFVRGQHNSPNLLFNPSGGVGLTGWTAKSSNPALMPIAAEDTAGGGHYFFFPSDNTPSAVVEELESDPFPYVWNQPEVINADGTVTFSGYRYVNLSAMLYTYNLTSGTFEIGIRCYSANKTLLGIVSNIVIDVNNKNGWQLHDIFEAVADNTQFISVYIKQNGCAQNSYIGVRRIRVEASNQTRVFSDDQTINRTAMSLTKSVALPCKLATDGVSINVGNTFTGTVDGVNIADGMRVLLKDQSGADGINGIYVYNATTQKFVATNDFRSPGTLVSATDGVKNANQIYIRTNYDTVVSAGVTSTSGTTSLTALNVSGAINAGTIVSSGNISAAGDIHGANLSATSNISAGGAISAIGDMSCNNLGVSGLATLGSVHTLNVVADGSISAASDISCNTLGVTGLATVGSLHSLGAIDADSITLKNGTVTVVTSANVASFSMGSEDVKSLASAAAVTLDLNVSTSFRYTPLVVTTLSISNAKVGKVNSATLVIYNGGNNIIWPAGVKWRGGVPPLLTVYGTDIVTFVNYGNTDWYGFVAGQDMK